MCKKVIIGALLGGVVLLLWQSAVHMVLGVYDDAFVKLKDPAAVEAVLKDNLDWKRDDCDSAARYRATTDAEAKAMEKLTTGFSMSGAVNRDGRTRLRRHALGVQFAVNVLASAVLMFVLLAANPPTLGCPVWPWCFVSPCLRC